MTQLTHWSADNAACVGNGCPLAENCKRHHGHLLAAAQQRQRQVYRETPEEGECYSYWPMLEAMA